jgi:hypothetical protein
MKIMKPVKRRKRKIRIWPSPKVPENSDERKDK